MQPIGERTGTFSDRRLYVTMRDELVEEGNQDAAFLAYPIGGEVQPRHLVAYKRILRGDRQSSSDELPDVPARARRSPARKRAAKTPNKMAKPADNK
jgi:hypothetical protein